MITVFFKHHGYVPDYSIISLIFLKPALVKTSTESPKSFHKAFITEFNSFMDPFTRRTSLAYQALFATGLLEDIFLKYHKVFAKNVMNKFVDLIRNEIAYK